MFHFTAKTNGRRDQQFGSHSQTEAKIQHIIFHPRAVSLGPTAQRQGLTKHRLFGVLGWNRGMSLLSGHVGASSHSWYQSPWYQTHLGPSQTHGLVQRNSPLKAGFLIWEADHIICLQLPWMCNGFTWFKTSSPFGSEGENRITTCWTLSLSVGDLQVIF